MRKFLLTLILVTMTTTVIAKPANAAFNEKPLGGTLIWGTHTKPTIINPILTTCSVSTSLLDLVFNRLVRWNAKGEIEPDLAESWEISEDGLVYTFYLRRGVKFHDGRECTALDVKFTYDMIIDPKVDSPFKESFELIRTFRAVNKYTFQIILKKPFVPIMCRLTKEIMPKHLLDKTDIRISAFNFNPIGTGPFKFREWTKDNTIILEYNPDYYEGRPNLERIIIKTYSDSRALWTALMRREVDFVLFIEKEDYEVIKVDDTFNSYNLPVDYYYALCYDLNTPVLEDIRVRQAIAHAISIKALINTVSGGHGRECIGLFDPECLGFNPSIRPFEYNPEKAQKLLVESGWLEQDEDGIRRNQGKILELKVLVDARSDLQKKIAMFIRQELQEIGMALKVVLYNDDYELTQEFLKINKIQAHLKSFIGGVDPDQSEDDWGCEKMRVADKLWINKNVEVNKLFEEGKVEQDKEKRTQVYQKIQKLICNNQPACFLYFIVDFHTISAKFKNTEEFFTPIMPFHTIKDWFIKE